MLESKAWFKKLSDQFNDTINVFSQTKNFSKSKRIRYLKVHSQLKE